MSTIIIDPYQFVSASVGIEYLGFKQASSGSTEVYDLTIQKPSGVVEGDLLVAFVAETESTGYPLTPSGWTEIDSGGAGTGLGVLLAYKIAGASEPSGYTFKLYGGVRNPMTGVIAAFRGAAFDAATTPLPDRTTSPKDIASVNIAEDGSCLLFIGAAVSGSVTFSTPDGYTKIAQDNLSAPPSWALFKMEGVGAGETGIVAATASSYNVTGAHVVLSPA